jgi:hypothetical protein
MEGLETDACQLVGQLGDPGLMFHRGIGIGVDGRRLGRVLASCAMDMEQGLRGIVIGVEVAILERPGRRDATGMVDLVEIALAQPEKC